ncbi:MAG: sugar transferase [Bryobacteraceae bacterium]|jgi:lipopolysaccharide/colanic/teichoic acid biosynthesis glycosyltransferase
MFSFLRSLFSTRILSLLIPETILIFSCYILAAYWLGGADPSVFLLYDNGLLQIALVVAGVLVGLQLNKLYAQVGVRSTILLTQQLCLTLGVTFLLESLLSYLRIPELVLAPSTMMLGSALTLAVLLVWRVFYSAALWKSVGAKRVLFYGANAAAVEAVGSLAAHPELGLTPAGYIDDDQPAGTPLNGVQVLGSTAELARVVSEVHPDRIVIGVSERRGGVPFRELLDLQIGGIEIQRVAELYETACDRVCVAELLPSQLIFSDELGSRRGAIALQAIYSNIVALAGLALLAVLLLPIAAAIKLSSPGPVVEGHLRWGVNMVPFTLHRFRCRRADGRQTWVGAWLQRLHLDALPQLLNVIRGEMALVGPRAHDPAFIPVLMEKMPYYGQRHAVRPGVLGWSQLNCDYSRRLRDAREALEYDLYYIKHMSPALDAFIVLHSLMEVPFRDG